MLSITHILVSLLALWVGWVMAFDIWLALSWAALQHLSGWYDFPAGMWGFITAPTPWHSMAPPSIYVPEPPGLLQLHLWSMAGAAATTLLMLIGYWVVPLKKRVGSITQGKGVRLESDHPMVTNLLVPLAKKLGVRTPSLWLMPEGGVNAFAMAAPGRSAIILTTGAIETLKGELPWVLGHELAHIKHGDSLSRAFWLAAVDALRVVGRLRVRVLMLIARTTYLLPVVRLLAFPLTLFLSLLNMTSRFAESASLFVFRYLDSYIGRAMEYRADKVAAGATAPEEGVRALLTVSGHLESDFGGLFATHPTLNSRIERLRKQAKEIRDEHRKD